MVVEYFIFLYFCERVKNAPQVLAGNVCDIIFLLNMLCRTIYLLRHYQGRF
jgi:hypothetical protein